MKQSSKHRPEYFWPRVFLRKLLNIAPRDSDYSADTEDEDDISSYSGSEEYFESSHGRDSRFRESREEESQFDLNENIPRVRRRRNSETCRAQYIDSKDIRICVGTWNVGGKVPPNDLDIDEWIDMNDPADIYVFGLQEIVPLNAGNIFGAEDSRPVPKWENIIRETLNRVRPATTRVKCYSDPPSPSKFEPFDDLPTLEEEICLESDGDIGEEIYPLDEEPHGFDEFNIAAENKMGFLDSGVSEYYDGSELDVPLAVEQDLQRQFSSPKRLDRLNCLRTEDYAENEEASVSQQNAKFTKMLSGIEQNRKLTRILSGTERIGLSWPEPPLDLLSQHVLERPTSFKSIKTFTTTKSFRTYSSFKSINDMPPGIALLAELDLESLMKRKRRSSYVKIVSKQMVGIFLTIWVRKSLRRHIQNLKVSTVGVGVMGYIGNKGSVSVSMSMYQTLFCFICTHLTSGEKDGDEHKRNSDVHEILRRTHFHSRSAIGLPKRIQDHERIIWLGDLNYRLNLSYDKARELIAKREWSELTARDQLVRELRIGHTFDGWSEGALNFAPTYKYELNSEKYYGEDPKVGRRIPAWCDRILKYGKGLRQMSYRRSELTFSDHRPVTATYMAEVEIFCPKKLQRALTYTSAEIENEEVEAVVIDY
ncbi:Type I inositol 1,4,5-trisphosphate 5-phosphatase 1 [Hibiscus syriacus]|uniref:Type I inositol 1,4,5-trisphosphate 5-phosphatase 1 n=1 Tax=Hibiscus syriacus TaxID=106335 RepID=A0A6A2YVI4_HIBSY|nr:type IV inositol polyphosphate 5-phosphatase 3-like [Hibiscus syriacus]XP_039023189.1 type IV inositol polyphosphate 5-phosphatase 3-like [Hibiscus syriacus]XP_039023190.1 type IV inositol polyphosphate 5-phosphatase 3-like [Hibiscus syriacus]KAE8683403.1 Type I inositol 1,4,5-trisphosphate 5-phosphatase 1 [Hibiscus syriacus]